jgi:hypothetical protein
VLIRTAPGETKMGCPGVPGPPDALPARQRREEPFTGSFLDSVMLGRPRQVGGGALDEQD